MNVYNFIFSERRSVRLRRHLLFWTVWCIYLTLTYLIPTNWIPAWNLRGPLPHIEKYGIFLSLLRILLAAVLLTLVHLVLVYGILYFFLPRYFSRIDTSVTKKRNVIITTCLLVLFVCLISFLNYFNFVLMLYISTRIGYFTAMPGMSFILPLWGRQILFNYPTAVGFAVAIKLLKNWYLKQSEATQVASEKINAELQLLKAQVHPHFLFNTLNNIYSFIITNSPAAPRALKKLSALLHYLIYGCNQPIVKLEKELKMIKDYIDLEKIRYGENFNLTMVIRGDAANKMICPLLLIPFLENSFKHGASQMLTHPWINLEIIIERDDLYFNLSNSKPSLDGEDVVTKGLGLGNVKKRLAILYPDTHLLDIINGLMSFSISLRIPVFKENQNLQTVTTGGEIYELA